MDAEVESAIMQRAKILASGGDPDVSALTVIRDVEMLKTGIDYPLASGKMTFTKEDLADVVASQQDPAIQAPRLKIGHVDPRFDGEPALGKWINLRLTDEGQTLVGDCVGVPKWLAGIMGSAFPARSIEGNRDVETVTGNKWRVAVEAVALLGIQWPGITTLDDLPVIFSEDGPDGVEVAMTIAAAKQRLTAANVEDIRRQFYDSDAAYGWMWVREIYVEPNELIADDGDGGLYRIPYTVDGDTVTYGEATPVKIVYQDTVSAKIAASLYAQALHDTQEERVVASYSDPESSGAGKKEGEGMDPEVLKALGLPEDASAEQVTAALRDKGFAVPTAETPPVPQPDPEDEQSSDGEEEEQTTEETTESLVELAAKRGLVLVDSEGWKEVQAGAKAGQTLAAKAAEQTRDQILGEAIKAGKFPPARRDHFAQLYNADPEGTTELLAGMASGMVPVVEGGAAFGEGGDGTEEAYPKDWFPEIAAAQAGREGVPGQGKVYNERKAVN
jgi:hypothetical protein